MGFEEEFFVGVCVYMVSRFDMVMKKYGVLHSISNPNFSMKVAVFFLPPSKSFYVSWVTGPGPVGRSTS